MYAELKPDISAVATAPFGMSEALLRKNGNFLPHGVVLRDDGAVEHIAALPDSMNDDVNSAEVLPNLHAGLRSMAKETSVKAIGVSEHVTIELEGRPPTKAIKVLFEHRRGFVTALYLPYEKKFLRGLVFGATVAVDAVGEVNAWT